MGTVKFKTTSDIRDVERDLDKMRKDYAKLAEQVAKTGQASKKAGRDGSRETKGQTKAIDGQTAALKQAGLSIVGMVGAWGLVKSAIGLVKQDMEAYIELQRESAAIKKDLGGEQSTALLNMAGLPTKERKRVLESAPTIQAEASFPDQKQILGALGSTISAGATPDQAIETVTTAAKLTRQAPAMLPSVAGAAVDLQRSTGVEGAEQNLGFMLSAANFSRVKDFDQMAKSLPPSISAALTSVPGQDSREAAKQAGALFGDLSQRLTDFTGDITKTASRQLTSGMRTFFEEGMGGAQVMGPFQDPRAMDTLLGRMQVLASDPELKRTFLANAPLGEAKQQIEQLLTPEGIAGLRQKEAGITFDPQLTRDLQKEGGTLTPELRAGASEARLEGAVQARQQERDTSGTVRGILIDALKEDTGTGVVGDFIRMRNFDFRQSLHPGIENQQAGIDILKGALIKNLGPDAGPEGAANVRLLNKAIQAIEDLAVEARMTNRALQGGGAAAQVGAENR